MITTNLAIPIRRVIPRIAIASIAAIIAAQPIATMAATKSVLESGPFQSGDTVTVQIEFTKPSIAVTPTVELVAVVDTSRPIAPAIADFRTKLVNFVNNSLSQYPGAVRIGITKVGNGVASFDSNNANNPGANFPMYPTNPYSTNPRANSAVGIDKVVTINNGNISSLVSAINAIDVESSGNSATLDGKYSQPDQTNSYTSDIGAGMLRGAQMFTSDPDMARFMILLTDGEVNKSMCPLTSSGAPNIDIKGAQLQVLPSNTSYDHWLPVKPSNQEDTTFPTYYPTTYGEPGVCRNFILNNGFPSGLLTDNVAPHYVTSKPNTSILKEIANRYGGIRSEDIQTATLDKVVEAAKIAMITVEDTLNPDVFSSVSFASNGFTDCSGTTIGTTMVTQSGTSITLTSKSTLISTTTHYCLQLKATIKSSPPPGTQPINTGSNNEVRYTNGNMVEVGSETIGNSDIEIISSDLTLQNFRTTNSSGSQKWVFDRGEQIYVSAQARNLSSGATTSAVQTQIYKNKAASVAVGTTSDITPSGMYIQHGTFGGGTSYTYGSYPSGPNNGAYNGQKTWQEPSLTGVLTARAYINYNQSLAETSYTNNQVVSRYAVIVPPSNLQGAAASCHQASMTWNAGQGIGRYQVTLQNTTESTTTSTTTTGTSWNLDVGEGADNFTWYITPQVQIDGVWRSGNRVNGPSFSTPACPHFDITTSNPTTVNPGSTEDAYTTYTIEYLPTDSYWNPATDNITMAIRRFEPGSFTCESNPSLPAKGAKDDGNTDGGQVTARFTSGGDTILTVPALTKTGTLTVKAAATATLGTYTLCLGAWSNHASDEIMTTVIINTDMTAWLQIAGQSAGSQGAGDVHSNGPIGNLVIPSNPVQQYFFLTSSTGVISSTSTIGVNPSTRISSLFTNDWSGQNYPTSGAIKTPEYDAMLTDAGRKSTPEALSDNSKLLDNNSCNNGISKTFHIAGNALLDSGTTITFPTGCDGVQYTYFIDGNLYVHSNVIDQTKSGTLTFIVNGNVEVDSGISQMDGVYMFGGRFKDGASATQLVVHGSLLGLSGKSPSAGTGSFTQTGNVTGLQRDLGATENATKPAEIIYYQPKYLYVLRNSSLGGSIFSWTE